MHIQWHPCAENILASAGADPCLIVWNVETEEVLMRYTEFPDLIYSICWDYNGSRIATTCKDKKIRVLDARKGENLNVSPHALLLRASVAISLYLCVTRRARGMLATSHLGLSSVARLTSCSRLGSAE